MMNEDAERRGRLLAMILAVAALVLGGMWLILDLVRGAGLSAGSLVVIAVGVVVLVWIDSMTSVGVSGSIRAAPVALVSALVAAGLAGCSGADAGDAARAAEVVRSDSAGVEVVVNLAAAAAVPVFATLDSVPTLRLGSLGGRPEEQFGSVTDVVPLAAGGVAVLDGHAAEIRLFDSNGAYDLSLGSQGQGPGELQRPTELALLPGDTLAVYDAGSMRVTRFGPDGALGRVTTLQQSGGRIVVASFLPDGRLVGQSRWLAPDRGPPPGEEPTLVRDTAVLTLFTVDGGLEDTVDIVPGRESIQSIVVGDRSVSVSKRSPAFGRTNVFAGHPDGVWSSTNDRFELRLREAGSGRLIRIVRAPGLEAPVTDALARAIHNHALAEAETADDRRRVEAWYALSPRPGTQPAYDRVVVDDEARLWVRAWSPLDDATRWWVFARDGDLLGSVDVPSGTTITAVRCGRAWGIERDELDVSYVVRYALRGVAGC
ncbi:MAG: hypothetical protein ACRELV_01770 [Longimicrobiales bacterium]